MSVKNMNKKSQTDWKRLETMTEDEIDTSDIPPLGDDFFARAHLVPPRANSINLDDDVLTWFRAHSNNYQKQINRVLRQYIQMQKS